MHQGGPRQGRARIPAPLHGRGPHRAARLPGDVVLVRARSRGRRPRQPPRAAPRLRGREPPGALRVRERSQQRGEAAVRAPDEDRGGAVHGGPHLRRFAGRRGRPRGGGHRGGARGIHRRAQSAGERRGRRRRRPARGRLRVQPREREGLAVPVPQETAHRERHAHRHRVPHAVLLRAEPTKLSAPREVPRDSAPLRRDNHGGAANGDLDVGRRAAAGAHVGARPDHHDARARQGLARGARPFPSGPTPDDAGSIFQHRGFHRARPRRGRVASVRGQAPAHVRHDHLRHLHRRLGRDIAAAGALKGGWAGFRRDEGDSQVARGRGSALRRGGQARARHASPRGGHEGGAGGCADPRDADSMQRRLRHCRALRL
mmetsp:Transcript_4152/g.17054  ORF Transcript_4152/g.17054 Transcript_4152/m.17054 type:complete len:373 (+) Transcript_4152:583-1701(+)